MIPEKSVACYRNDLDLLGIFAIFTKFIFPSGRIFDQIVWQVIKIICYQVMRYWIFLSVSWMMPLFSFISRASLFFALVILTKVIQDKMLREVALTIIRSPFLAKIPYLFVVIPLAIWLESTRQLILMRLNVVYSLYKLHKWNYHERFIPVHLTSNKILQRAGEFL